MQLIINALAAADIATYDEQDRYADELQISAETFDDPAFLAQVEAFERHSVEIMIEHELTDTYERLSTQAEVARGTHDYYYYLQLSSPGICL